MNFIKKHINEASPKQYLTATEIDYLKDIKLHKEVLYCLTQIQKQLKNPTKNKTNTYNFIFTDVHSKLFKSIEFINDRLRHDGFKFEFVEIKFDNEELPYKSTIKFNISNGLESHKEYLFYEKLSETIQFYKIQIRELKKPTKTIKEIVHIDIFELIKMFWEPAFEETQYITRSQNL
jgi:hypothetical protein